MSSNAISLLWSDFESLGHFYDSVWYPCSYLAELSMGWCSMGLSKNLQVSSLVRCWGTFFVLPLASLNFICIFAKIAFLGLSRFSGLRRAQTGENETSP